MKTFNIKLDNKSYNVKANDAQQAVRLVKLLQKDYGNEDAVVDMLEKAVVAAKAKDWQKVGNICYNAIQVAKQLGAK